MLTGASCLYKKKNWVPAPGTHTHTHTPTPTQFTPAPTLTPTHPHTYTPAPTLTSTHPHTYTPAPTRTSTHLWAPECWQVAATCYRHRAYSESPLRHYCKDESRDPNTTFVNRALIVSVNSVLIMCTVVAGSPCAITGDGLNIHSL